MTSDSIQMNYLYSICSRQILVYKMFNYNRLFKCKAYIKQSWQLNYLWYNLSFPCIIRVSELSGHCAHRVGL